MKGLVLSLVLMASPAAAQNCSDAAGVKAAILAAPEGRWTELTNNEWEFMRGIYAMNPETGRGLPVGDTAFVAQVGSDTGALVFFIDGPLACDPMPIPKELLDILKDVQAGTITHEKGGL